MSQFGVAIGSPLCLKSQSHEAIIARTENRSL